MKRSWIRRGTRRVGAAARERVRAGGVLAKGRESETLAGWNALKRELLRLAQGRCEACGATVGIFDPEHAKDRGDGGKDVLDNVWLSCRTCHEMKTAPYVKGRLRVLPLGDGRFQFQLWKGVSKWECTMIREWLSLPRAA